MFSNLTKEIKIECISCGQITLGKKTLDKEYDIYTYDLSEKCSVCGEELDERCEIQPD